MKEAMIYDFAKYKKRKVNPSFQLFDKVVLILNMVFSYVVAGGYIWLLFHAPARDIAIALALMLLTVLTYHIVKTVNIMRKAWNDTEIFQKNADYLAFYFNAGFAIGLFATILTSIAINYTLEQKIIVLSVAIPVTVLELYMIIRFARKEKVL